MSDTIQLPAEPDTPDSPFDAIRQEDDRGEWWSARDLQPMMGYEKWDNFDEVVQRAIRSSENTGTYSDQAFSRVREEGTGGAPRANYRLNRYGAYLTAMNGDPNKPAVAAAQAYFATKTREAELGTGRPMSELELARRYVAVVERELAAQKELEVARPKASKWDKYCNADGLIGMSELADIMQLSVQKLTSWLVEMNMFRRQTSESGGNRNMPRTMYQRSGHFCVKAEEKNGRAFPVAYASTVGVDLVVDAWERQGHVR